MKILNWYRELMGIPIKYHYYSVRFLYKAKHSSALIFDFQTEVGFVDQISILNHRTIKTAIKPIHKIDSALPYLCNGILTTEVTAYLGYFKKPI